jgi:hypothetical protein
MNIRVISGLAVALMCSCAFTAAADDQKPILPQWTNYSCAWFTSDVDAIGADKLGLSTMDRAVKLNVIIAFTAGYSQKVLEAKQPKAVMTDEMARPVIQKVLADCRSEPNKLVIDVIDEVVANVDFKVD